MSPFIQPTQAYAIRLAPQPAPFSVLKFSGSEALSQLYRYEVEFTSAIADIPMDQVLGRHARFVIEPVAANAGRLHKIVDESVGEVTGTSCARTVHGIVTQFDQFGTSADETQYRLVIEPRAADLARAPTSRLFQKQSVPEIITDTLQHFGFRHGVDFRFNLRAQYKRHDYITQYHETTFAFIQRLVADSGIWFRFEQAKDGEMIVFGDDLDAYARKQRVVPLRRDAGLHAICAESVQSLSRHVRRVPEAVQLNDYNHRQADVSLLVEQNTARDDKTTNAVDSSWGAHYETPEEGRRLATIRHEAHLAQQITYAGEGNAFALEPGEVLRFDCNPVDAPHGLFVVTVKSRGGRSDSYSNAFTAIPADRVWRTTIAPDRQPVIPGILPARIGSPGDYKRAYLSEEGWYVVKLPFDLDSWSPGGTSRPVRLARPYSGDNYGHHFPLLDGAEVAIVFTAGHPDRPVIVGAMHDSLHPDLVNNLNHTQNLIRTAAQNELGMEDREGNEHIHLSTPFQTSKLNLGHMVDAKLNERGQGAELRTDGHVAIRGAKGVLVSADVQSRGGGHQLDTKAAHAQLEQALAQSKSLAAAANTARAFAAEYEKQQVLLDATLDQLKRACILMSAPAGIALTSGEHLQLNAVKNLIGTSGGNVDIGAGRHVTLSAGQSASLFAQQEIRLIAASGDFTARAEEGQMRLVSAKNLQISSVDGTLLAAAGKSMTLTCGGAYIKLEGGNIELGCPGDIRLKCEGHPWEGPASANVKLPLLPRKAFNAAPHGIEPVSS